MLRLFMSLSVSSGKRGSMQDSSIASWLPLGGNEGRRRQCRRKARRAGEVQQAAAVEPAAQRGATAGTSSEDASCGHGVVYACRGMAIRRILPGDFVRDA